MLIRLKLAQNPFGRAHFKVLQTHTHTDAQSVWIPSALIDETENSVLNGFLHCTVHSENTISDEVNKLKAPFGVAKAFIQGFEAWHTFKNESKSIQKACSYTQAYLHIVYSMVA